MARSLLSFPIVLLLALCLMGGEALGEKITIERIAAKVNDEIITLSEVQEEAKGELQKIREQFQGEDRRLQSRQAELKALDKLIEKTLMLQRAKELEITVSDKEVETAIELIKQRNRLSDAALKAALKRDGIDYEQYRERIRRELLLGAVERREVNAHIVVGDDDLVRFYRDNISRYMKDEQRKAHHIFFALEPNADRREVDRVMSRARATLAKLQNPSNFEDLARKYSEGPAASKGGDLGYIKKDEVFPEFERLLFSLKPGQVGGPVRTRAGVHIVKLDEIKGGLPVPLEKVKDAIRSEVHRRKREERYREWIAELKQKAFLEVNYDEEGKERGSLGVTSRDGQKLVETYVLRKIQLLESEDPIGKEQIYWGFGKTRRKPLWWGKPIHVNELMALDEADLAEVENKFKFFEEPDGSYRLFFYEEDTWGPDDYLGSLSFQEVVQAFKADPTLKERGFLTDSKKLKIVIQFERRLVQRIVSGRNF